MRRSVLYASFLALGASALLGRRAEANERKFTYTYESATLPAGTRELEFWTTWRTGRGRFYSEFDHRIEAEIGVTDRLLTSLYVNWFRVTQQDPANPSGTVSSSDFDGISSEWKYKLLDPVADPVGLAFYQEYTVHSDEFEWESKAILDKKIGNSLLAYNAVIEPAWDFHPGGSDYTLLIEHDLGYTYFFTPAFSAGLEAHNQGTIDRKSTGFRYNAMYLGPVVSYAREGWWLTLTVLRQLPAIKRSIDNPQDRLVLDTQEKLNVRIIGSIRI